MERKKNIFDFLAQVLTIFGFMILVINLFCPIFGESAKGYSSIFSLGAQGISAATTAQYFALSILIAAARFLFFTDRVIRRMAIWLRTVCMLSTVLLVITAFILLFDWFPVDQWQPWGMFLLCFALSFLGSLSVMTLKERMENRQLAAALRRVQRSGEEDE